MRKFLLSCLLLLCARLSWSVSSDLLVVTQSPDVSFQEGETGNISCCWKGKVYRVGITWFKNQILIQNKSVINQSTGSQTEQVNSCSVLTFPKFTTKDSGKYICKVAVEIPTLTVVEGHGTTIRVTAAETPAVTTDHHGLNDVPQQDVLTMVLRCLPILVLITAFFLIHCLWTKAQKDTRVSAASENGGTLLESRDEQQETVEGRDGMREAAGE